MDAGQSDLKMIPISDLTPVGTSGCADGKGMYLGAAWACPGMFGGTNPSAAQRCAIGWVPCAAATGIELAACKALPGFFASSFIGRNPSGTNVTCMTPNGSNRGIFGCGGPSATETACMGFDQALVCASSPDWVCADQLDQIRNNNAQDGVLCCK